MNQLQEISFQLQKVLKREQTIAEITLTLKDGITAQNTTVNIK